MKLFAFTDGASRGNPGLAGAGIVLRDADTGAAVLESAEFLGRKTCNEAEYLAAISALEKAADLGCTHLTLRTDSKLVVEQLSGRWKVKHPNMRPLFEQARALERRFKVRPVYQWIPRERNGRADRLSNDAIDHRDRPDTEEVDALDIPPRLCPHCGGDIW